MKKALFLLSCCLAAVTLITSLAYGQGATRVLVCRGKPGIVLKVQTDPSPDNPRYVRVVLQYERATQKVDEDFNNLAPGTCAWNPANWPDVPVEPGIVYFDLPKEAQPWSETVKRLIDTTLNAAVHFPDMITLPRYLNDPSKYWLFYVDDKTNFSVSYTATKHHAGAPVFTEITGVAGARQEELLCRGGPSLGFTKGSVVGDNRVEMQLEYTVSSKPPGSMGAGLAPGTCAWINPVGIVKPPAQIQFTTAGNAQLSQTLRGDPVDRSSTAAEKWPDANTIPVYMSDPNHYWSFKTVENDPATARSHSVWKPSIGSTPRSTTADKTSDATKPRDRNKSSSSSVVGRSQSLEYVTVDRKLDQFSIRFRARKNASAQVRYSTSAPIQEPSTGRLYFPGAGYTGGGGVEQIGGFQAEVSIAKPLPLVSGAEFVGRSRLKPKRGTVYHFIIRIPKDANGTEEQYTGQFTTMSQTVRVELETVKILKEPPGLNSYWSWVLFSGDGSGEIATSGNMILDLKNASERVRMIVGAEAEEDAIHQEYIGKRHWTLTPKAGMGIALIKHEFDTRSMTPGKRYPFNLTSMRGMDIEFYISGYVEISHQ
ncbi:MAG TPA: hypothetical protein VGD17_06325 [Chitinophagaceae bacterium]